MYAQVIVLTYQSPEIDSYTYEIPKELEGKVKVGQLVSVPFGKRSPLGIVLSITPTVIPAKAGILKGDADPRIREDDKSSGVDKKEIRIKPVSSIVLEKPILYPYQIKLLIWMSSYYLAPMVNCLKTMLPEIPKRIEKLQITNKRAYFLDKLENYKLQNSNQTLVLVPSINHLPQILAKFPQSKNYAIYTNELKPAEKFNT
jgi:primosomal protein N'